MSTLLTEIAKDAEFERSPDYWQAVKDGFVSRGDIIGNFIARINMTPMAMGYIAEEYSLANYRKDAEGNRRLTTSSPIKRTIGEHIFKVAGNVAGLTTNIISLGLLNCIYLSDIYCIDKRQSH